MITHQYILSAPWGATVKFRFSMALNEKVSIMGPRESLHGAVHTRNDALLELGMDIPDDDHYGWFPLDERKKMAIERKEKARTEQAEADQYVEEAYGGMSDKPG